MLETTIVTGTRYTVRGGVNTTSYASVFDVLAQTDITKATWLPAPVKMSPSKIVYTLPRLRPSAFIPGAATTITSGNIADRQI